MEQIFNQLSEVYEASLVTNLKSVNEHLNQMKISELWTLINSKKTNLKNLKGSTSEEVTENGGMQQEESSGPQPIKYVSNILDVLQKVKFKVKGIEAEKLNQLYAGVYEGGFLLWECERDAVEFVHYSGWMDNFDHVAKEDAKILEIGCGSGLLGVYLLQ
jgi:hypothetical protein